MEMADEYDPAFPTEETDVQELQTCAVQPETTDAVSPNMADKNPPVMSPPTQEIGRVRTRYRTRSQTMLEGTRPMQDDLSKTEKVAQVLDPCESVGTDSKPSLEKEMEEFEKLVNFDGNLVNDDDSSKNLTDGESPSQDIYPDVDVNESTSIEPVLHEVLVPGSVPNADSSTVPNADSSTVPNADSSTVPNADSSTVPNADSSTVPNADSSTVLIEILKPVELTPLPSAETEHLQSRSEKKQSPMEIGSLPLEEKPNSNPPLGKNAENLIQNPAPKGLGNIMLPRSVKVNSVSSEKLGKKTRKQSKAAVALRRFGKDKESSLAKDSPKEALSQGKGTNGLVKDPSLSKIEDGKQSPEKLDSACAKKNPVVEWMVGFVRKDAAGSASSDSDLWDYDVDTIHPDEALAEFAANNALLQYMQAMEDGNNSMGVVPVASSTDALPESLPQDPSATTEGLSKIPISETKVTDSCTNGPALESEINDVSLDAAPEHSQESKVHVPIPIQIDLKREEETSPLNTSLSDTQAVSESQLSSTVSTGKVSHKESSVDETTNVCFTEKMQIEPAEITAVASPSPTTVASVNDSERKMDIETSKDSVSSDNTESVPSIGTSVCPQDQSAKERLFKPIQASVEDQDPLEVAKDLSPSISPRIDSTKQRKRSWRGSKGKNGSDETNDAMPTRRSTRLRSIDRKRQSESPKELLETTTPPARKRRLSSRNSNASPTDDCLESESSKRTSQLNAEKEKESPTCSDNLEISGTESTSKTIRPENCLDEPMDISSEPTDHDIKSSSSNEETSRVLQKSKNEEITSISPVPKTIAPEHISSSEIDPKSLYTETAKVTTQAAESISDSNIQDTHTDANPTDRLSPEVNMPSESSTSISESPPSSEQTSSEVPIELPSTPAAKLSDVLLANQPESAKADTEHLSSAATVTIDPVIVSKLEVSSLGASVPMNTEPVVSKVISEIETPSDAVDSVTRSSPPSTSCSNDIQPAGTSSTCEERKVAHMDVDEAIRHMACPNVQLVEDTEIKLDKHAETLLNAEMDKGNEPLPVLSNDHSDLPTKNEINSVVKNEESQSDMTKDQSSEEQSMEVDKSNMQSVAKKNMEDVIAKDHSVTNNTSAHHNNMSSGGRHQLSNPSNQFTQDVWEANFADSDEQDARNKLPLTMHIKTETRPSKMPESIPDTRPTEAHKIEPVIKQEEDTGNLKMVEEGELIEKTPEDSPAAILENSRESWGIVTGDKVPAYENILENYYLSERKKSKAGKEARRMVCDCTTSKSERARGFPACGEDCLNRLLLIECTSRCPCNDYCTNRRFIRREYADVGIFYAENKGHGLKAKADLRPHEFVMEYCGEVLNYSEFMVRVKRYNKEDQIHFYFMALGADEIIDATLKGNMSRFINHSCDPNCETQKWTVNGNIRVGFVTKKPIAAGTELTFDYQFEQYGNDPQKCLCGSANCRGFIGKPKRTSKLAAGKDLTPKRRESLERKRKETFEDASLDDEIEQLCSELDGRGLRTNDQTLTLARHMVLAETTTLRLQLLKILEDTSSETCLKHFLTHHGLKLLWSWMVDIGDKPEPELKIEILNTLMKLPIPHRNALDDSKILAMVERWSKVKHLPKAETEHEDSSAGEMPSRSATPIALNAANRSLTELTKIMDGLNSESDGDPEKVSLKDVGKSEKMEGIAAETGKLTETKASKPTADEKTTEVDSSTSNVEDSDAVQPEGSTSPVRSESSNVTQSEIISQSESSEIKVAEGTRTADDTSIDLKLASTSASVSQQESDGASSSNSKTDSATHEMESAPQPTADPETVITIKEPSLPQTPKPNNLEEGELPQEQAQSKSGELEKLKIGTGQDKGPVADVVDTSSIKAEKSSGIALMAGKLLESWRSLKEIYRIPKNRDRERDRDYSERDRDKDRGRDRDRDRKYGRDRERDRDYDRDRDRDRDKFRDRDSRREHSRERDRYRDRDRDRDKKRIWERRDDRKRRSRSASKEKDDKPASSTTEKKDTETSKATLPKLRKPWKNETTAKGDGPPGKNKNDKPALSKQERRQQFAKQVEQAEMEEEMRKQQQEEFLGQNPHFVDEEGNIHFLDANGYPIPPPFDGDPNHPMFHMMQLDQGLPMEHGGMHHPDGMYTHPMNPDLGYPDMMPHHPPGMVPYDENGMPLPMHGHGQPMYDDMQPNMGPLLPDPLMHHQHGLDGLMPQHVMPAEAMHVMQEHDPQGWESNPAQGHPQPVLQQTQFRVPAPPGANPTNPIPVLGASRPSSFVAPAQPQPAAQTHVVQQPVVQAQPQAAAPTQTVTFVTPDGMLVTQTIMPLNTESTVQTNLQQAQQMQQHLSQGMSTTSQGIPSPPSKPKSQQLPPNWRTARDQEGKIYYYHAITRQTQWDMPSWDGNAIVPGGPEADMDLGTPTYDEKSKKRTTTADADTTSKLAKRCKLQFRSKMSHYVISCLNTYRKPDCKVGRITNTEDFKHLARKLTHGIMDKELKHCKNFEDLEVNSNVKHKAKEYIRKYMAHVGPVYHKDD